SRIQSVEIGSLRMVVGREQIPVVINRDQFIVLMQQVVFFAVLHQQNRNSISNISERSIEILRKGNSRAFRNAGSLFFVREIKATISFSKRAVNDALIAHLC